MHDTAIANDVVGKVDSAPVGINADDPRRRIKGKEPSGGDAETAADIQNYPGLSDKFCQTGEHGIEEDFKPCKNACIGFHVSIPF